MILALDKFKVTAMGFIDANSTEAMKLQSRSFDSLPQFTPLTTQQTSVQAANDKLATAIADYTKQITDLANAQKTSTQSDWQKLQNDNNARIKELQAKAANDLAVTKQLIESTFADIIAKGQEQDRAKEEEYRKKSLELAQSNNNRLHDIAFQLRHGVTIRNLNGKDARG